MHHSLVDWHEAKVPDHRVLEGFHVRLEALDAVRHGDDLWRHFHGTNSDPNQWDYMFSGPFVSQSDFDAYLKRITKSDDLLLYAVIDITSGEAQGFLAFRRIIPAHGNLEIGPVNFGAAMRRSVRSTEAVYLLIEEAFALGYRRVEWKCNNENERSKRTAERFGFRFEGLFRQHFVFKGRNRDTAYFSILDNEWPALKAAFVRWLADDNFDDQGRQIQTLAALRRVDTTDTHYKKSET
uniref:N-acetyltransferase domain-containing protein n=1 Tax=Plectus sambesii TaxID=2011161 RepID=A0A914WHH8_9BILA